MAEPLDFRIDRIATPIGELIVVADREERLRTIDWTDHEARMTLLLDRSYGKGGYRLTPKRDPGGLSSAMRRYFEGDIGVLADLPVATAGTPFQSSVWQALRGIECGTTISYAELARRIGKPRAVRAAGLANGQNPIGIVVPCHRVIGSNGSLTGYGGGLERKQWLLKHERVARMNDRETLEELNREYIVSVQSCDVKRFGEILSEDFLNTNPDGTLVDKAGFLEQVAPPAKVGNLACHDVNVRVMGDFAIIHARTSYTLPDGRRGNGRYTDMWARRGGKWLCVAAQVARS